MVVPWFAIAIQISFCPWSAVDAIEFTTDPRVCRNEQRNNGRRTTYIRPTNRPGFMAACGSRAALTRSAIAQSGRGWPQTPSAFLPRGRTARQDQVAAFLGGHLLEFRDRPRHILERPFALGVGADDPVAGVGLHRPSFRVQGFDERRDRRRTDIGDEADRPDAVPPETRSVRSTSGCASAPSRIAMSSSTELRLQPIELPPDRARVVFVADGEDPLTCRQAQSLADDCARRSVQELDRDRPRSRLVELVERIGEALSGSRTAPRRSRTPRESAEP